MRKNSDYKQFCEATFLECLVNFSESLKLYLIFSKSQFLPPVCIFLFRLTDTLFVTKFGTDEINTFLCSCHTSVPVWLLQLLHFLLRFFFLSDFFFFSREMTQIFQGLNLCVYRGHTFALHPPSCLTSIPFGLIGDGNCGIFQ